VNESNQRTEGFYFARGVRVVDSISFLGPVHQARLPIRILKMAILSASDVQFGVCETLAAIFDKIWKHANANQNWKTELSQK